MGKKSDARINIIFMISSILFLKKSEFFNKRHYTCTEYTSK